MPFHEEAGCEQKLFEVERCARRENMIEDCPTGAVLYFVCGSDKSLSGGQTGDPYKSAIPGLIREDIPHFLPLFFYSILVEIWL